MNADLRQKSILSSILREREKQDSKWGEQNHPSVIPRGTQPVLCGILQAHYDELRDERRHECQEAAAAGLCTWTHIALEELWEAIACRTDAERREELIQLAAVVVAWIECIDRKAEQ